MYEEIETVFGCKSYMNCNNRRDVRVCFAKLRLSSHKYYCWLNCARWPKEKCPTHNAQVHSAIVMI